MPNDNPTRWTGDLVGESEAEGFEVRECRMLTAREWSWMVASAALAAMLVGFVLFGTCELVGGDCRIVWHPVHDVARAETK